MTRGEQRGLHPRGCGVAAAEGLFAPSHTWAAVASLMNGAGLAAPPRLRGALRPTPFGRAPRPSHARPAPDQGGQSRLNQLSHDLLVPNQALVYERPPGCESGALRRHCEEAIGWHPTKQSRGATRLLQATSERPGLRNDGDRRSLNIVETLDLRPTGLEPVAFTHHRHPGESGGPGAARITQDNHAA